MVISQFKSCDPLLLGIWPTHVKEVSKKVSWNQKKQFENMNEKFWFFPSTFGVDECWLAVALPYSFDSQERWDTSALCTTAMSKFLEKKNEDCWTILLSNSISDIWFYIILKPNYSCTAHHSNKEKIEDICDVYGGIYEQSF